MTTRDRIVILVMLTLGALAGSWMFVIQPKREQAAKLGGQIRTQQAQLAGARAQVAADEAARAAFPRNYTQLAKLGEAVPADDNVPSLIVQLQGAAIAAGVDFRSLLLTSSSGSATTPGQAQPLPPGATVGAAGLPTEQFTFSFRGNFFRLSDFFDRVERFVVAAGDRVSVSGRLLSLNAITLGPSPQGFPHMAATVSATTYLAPPSQAPLTGTTPAGQAGSQVAPNTTAGGPAATGSPALPTAAIGAPGR